MSSPNSDEQLLAYFPFSFESLFDDEKAACIDFQHLREDRASFEAQKSSDTGIDGVTSIDLQKQQVAPITAEILANLEYSIQTERESQASQPADDFCDNSSRQSHTGPDLSEFIEFWDGSEAADAYRRDMAAHALPNVETSASQSLNGLEPAPPGDGVPSKSSAATSTSEASVDQAHITILSSASETVDITTAYRSECSSDSSSSGYLVQSEPYASAFTAHADVADTSTVFPSASETVDVDVGTVYHPRSSIDSVAPGYFVQTEPYATASAQRDVVQGSTTILPLGPDTADLITACDSQGAIDSVASSYFVPNEQYTAVSTVQEQIEQAPTAAPPSVSSFDPVASGYYDQSALSAHQNAANSHYSTGCYPYASGDPRYSRAAILQSQVPQPINSGWVNTGNAMFQQCDLTNMVPPGSVPMSMLYPSMDMASSGKVQQYGQSAGLQPQYPPYASSSAVAVPTASRPVSTFFGGAFIGNVPPASRSTVATYHGQQIHIPVPYPIPQVAPLARSSRHSQLQRSHTSPYSQYTTVFPSHSSFSSQTFATSSFTTTQFSSSSSHEQLPDNDTNVPRLSGAVRTKDGKKGKGKVKDKKPYTPKPTPALRRTQSDTSATRFLPWDPSQLSRKLSSTPESDGSGSSTSSSGRRRKTMPIAVKCLWEKCEGPSFTDREALRKHIHTHTGSSRKDPMTCLWKDCKKIMQVDSVVRHILSGHAFPDEFACDLCGASCSRSDAELRHRKDICKVCAGCKLQFKTVDDRFAHEQQCRRF
ncbi:hypothetical protein BD410DRAFT_136935 [Rickenella mellea]|uniref:C2H2-type domain-containing protein n=1 Tax=Rickenella mellea TaxID=50990 RepID=A0A4Y7PJF9_9AGAM|nr:hypothetical protein BD410DRAFT_136935 [Rickenella mellea]